MRWNRKTEDFRWFCELQKTSLRRHMKGHFGMNVVGITRMHVCYMGISHRSHEILQYSSTCWSCNPIFFSCRSENETCHTLVRLKTFLVSQLHDWTEKSFQLFRQQQHSRKKAMQFYARQEWRAHFCCETLGPWNKSNQFSIVVRGFLHSLKLYLASDIRRLNVFWVFCVTIVV